MEVIKSLENRRISLKRTTTKITSQEEFLHWKIYVRQEIIS